MRKFASLPTKPSSSSRWQTNLPVALLGAAVLLLPGCGGASNGGSSGNALTSGEGAPFSYGSLSGRAALTNPPTTTNGSGATVTALKGAITSLNLNDTDGMPIEGRIAFTSNRDGNDEIYTISPDGKQLLRMTNSPGKDRHPTWSPDGRRIAFASDRDGDNEIFVMNAATGSIIAKLTNNSADDIDPCWSPDGRRIAFASNRDGKQYDIYTMNADGTNQTRVTTEEGNFTEYVHEFAPTYSPDGSKIAYLKQKITSGTIPYLIDGDIPGDTIFTVDGTNTETAFRGSLSPDSYTDVQWMSDGQISFSENNALNRMSFANPVVTTPTVFGTSTSRVNWHAWSPDTTKVVYSRYNTAPNGGSYTVYIRDAKTNREILILADNSSIRHLAWSPTPKTRSLLGPSGLLGVQAAGLLFGTGTSTEPAPLYEYNNPKPVDTEMISSVVVFDASNRSGIVLNNQTGLNNTGPTLVFSIETDAPTVLNKLSFVQNPHYQTVNIIGPGSSLPTANGALVNFSAKTGFVTAVLPFDGTRAAGSAKPTVAENGGQRVFKGRFVGVWDQTGKNLAERGASEVHLDTTTGTVLSIR